MRRNSRLIRCASVAALLSVLGTAPTLGQNKPANPGDAFAKAWPATRICVEIERVALAYKLPKSTFARLIWTESRFDVGAISPVGAQGIAQFMPATAASMGLTNPFDPALALPKSAELLAQLLAQFGNFGLAAAAYNAGPGRVNSYLNGRSGLPFETQDYVVALTGKSAAFFKKPNVQVDDFALQPGKSFQEACSQLPVRKLRFRGGIAGSDWQPWGVQVAGSFSRARAMNSWARVRGRLGLDVGASKPALYRDSAPRGMKRRWAVRLGTAKRSEAIALCKRIRRAGGFCLVKRNR